MSTPEVHGDRGALFMARQAWDEEEEKPMEGKYRLMVSESFRAAGVEMDEAQVRQVIALLSNMVVGTTSFEAAWAKKEAEGYKYGQDALENVRLGWNMAIEALREEPKAWTLESLIIAVRDKWAAAWKDGPASFSFHEAFFFGIKPKPERELSQQAYEIVGKYFEPLQRRDFLF